MILIRSSQTQRNSQFMNLNCVFKLGALATSCSSERTFSDAGKAYSNLRTSMKPQKLSRAVYLKGNRHCMVPVKELIVEYERKHNISGDKRQKK